MSESIVLVIPSWCLFLWLSLSIAHLISGIVDIIVRRKLLQAQEGPKP